MEVTQEAILKVLVEEGGKLKNSELVSKFKDSLNCADQAEKKQYRDLFKRFVNNVAVVKEIEEVKYVVIRKKYQHLIQADDTINNADEDVQDILSPVQESKNSTQHSQDGRSNIFCAPERVAQQAAISSLSQCASNDSETHPPPEERYTIELALERVQSVDFKPKRSLNFSPFQTADVKVVQPFQPVYGQKTTVMHSKPYALPLRTPPSATRIEIQKLKTDDDPPLKADPEQDTYRYKRRPSTDSVSHGSPQLRRATKSSKPIEEPKFSSTLPLEQAEHQWLVGSASGHWSQVYGLLMRDTQLADKRDFLSGFTALHWAAKCGKSDMVTNIMEKSKEKGVQVDVNAKSHGGYTPLHIAALHNQEFIMAMLVNVYGADVNVRDNSGKKPYRYLHGGITDRVRKILTQPNLQPQEETVAQEKEELDLFPDLSKGLQTISRLFQPHVPGTKKKKQRAGLYSLGDEPREEREEGSSKHRASDMFT
ncbi:ankyrin repeat domain-containing protein SOWAHA-like [Hypomesus transpacificus]|uniref:ankyrin repeat domain-containing protein SOWAHA-like n=1 Tax=Hypomesus transpacificus TaxID=137520 RepID=UPI001F08180C|nr:ankyrin repeat domain-containing protein SOWAHA-like [Hypomesus transpacificus]